MNLETIELHKSKSTEPHTPDNLSFTKDSIADASIDTNKIVNVKLNEVMNYILQNSYGVNDYSTNELNRIIIFSGYNKVKCMGLIEEMTKEELMGLVEKWDADQEKSALARLKVEDEGSKVKKKKVKTKEIIVSNLQNSSDKLEEKISHEKCWEFIHYSPNIVDIKDLLLNHDHLKMLREAKKIKNKDNKQINDFFDTFFQNRLKKIKELITRSVNIDDNDFHFLSTCDHGLDIKNRVFKGIPTINYNAFNIKIQIPNDADKLEQNMNRLPDGLKSYLLKYLDIFSIGKLGLANKSFHNLVYKNFDLESLARSNCIAIFKNSQLYENNKRSLENTFSNYLDMLCYRPRVRFSGIYFSRLKTIRVTENLGFGEKNVTTVFCHRFLRFFPNGEVFSITSDQYKSQQIWNLLIKNPDRLELKRGVYFIDEDNYLRIRFEASNNTVYVYTYKFIDLREISFINRFNGLELIECLFKYSSETISLKINENFPKIFKFRPMNIIKKDINLKTRIDEIIIPVS